MRAFVEEMQVDVAERRQKAIRIAALPRRAVDVGDAKAIGQRQRSARQEHAVQIGEALDVALERNRRPSSSRHSTRAALAASVRTITPRAPADAAGCAPSIECGCACSPATRRKTSATASVAETAVIPLSASSRRAVLPVRRISACVVAAATAAFPFRLRVSFNAHSWNARTSSDGRVCVGNIHALESGDIPVRNRRPLHLTIQPMPAWREPPQGGS